MDNIDIKNTSSQLGKWQFEVTITNANDNYEYTVTLDKDYYMELTKEKIPAGQLIQDAFMFLLAHEPKDKILKEFDLSQIKDYFPDFEKQIKQ